MMAGKLSVAFGLLLSVGALRADVFSFSFSGNGGLGSVSASGTVTAVESAGFYTITGLTGIQNGKSISLYGSGNRLIYSGASGVGTLQFLVSGLPAIPYTVVFTGSGFSEIEGIGIDKGTNFKITRAVSEESAVALLLAMGLGVLLLGRKLAAKKDLHI